MVNAKNPFVIRSMLVLLTGPSRNRCPASPRYSTGLDLPIAVGIGSGWSGLIDVAGMIDSPDTCSIGGMAASADSVSEKENRDGGPAV